MDIRALRYFQTVAECGSYSRGAELLRISQPAVSRRIANLEQDLGVALFHRHGHGVNLTEAGQALLARSQEVLRTLEQARAEIRSTRFGPSGVITFAVPPAAAWFLVPPLVRRFGVTHPNVFLRVVGGFSSHIHEWLVRGQADIACLHDPLPQKGFEITPLMEEEVFLVGKAGTAPFRGTTIGIADLADVPLLLPSRPNASRRLLDGWAARTGVTLNIRAEVDDHTIIRALIRDGIGFSLLTRGAFDADLGAAAVQAWRFEPRAYWPLAAIRAADRARTPILEAFHTALCEVAREVRSGG